MRQQLLTCLHMLSLPTNSNLYINCKKVGKHITLFEMFNSLGHGCLYIIMKDEGNWYSRVRTTSVAWCPGWDWAPWRSAHPSRTGKTPRRARGPSWRTRGTAIGAFWSRREAVACLRPPSRSAVDTSPLLRSRVSYRYRLSNSYLTAIVIIGCGPYADSRFHRNNRILFL